MRESPYSFEDARIGTHHSHFTVGDADSLDDSTILDDSDEDDWAVLSPADVVDGACASNVLMDVRTYGMRIDVDMHYENVTTVTGMATGVKGHSNSCYLDAMLYACFAHTDVIDR